MTSPIAKFAQTLAACCTFAVLLCVVVGCSRQPSIVFLQVPAASSGGNGSTALLSGRVVGKHHGRHIFLYSFADGIWWVQPFASAPATEISEGGAWSAQIHLGTQYAALLSEDDALPPHLLNALPAVGKTVEAVAIIKASGKEILPPRPSLTETSLRFSGLDWIVRKIPGDFGAKTNEYSSDNVSVDASGALHLHLVRDTHGWVCSEIHTVRSLGYGSYTLQVEDVGNLEPAVMFSAFTFFEDSSGVGHSEMDIHITRRGVATNKNAEFIVQPSFVPTNFYHFEVPSGLLRLGLDWHPDEADFFASRGSNPRLSPIASWQFRTGVPIPDDTHLYINLCNYGYASTPPTHNAEVVVKAFEFYP